ncbi:hypothetical protein CLH_3245 [Clostridium botulinum E3 str. Alaska E43]|nr:hypothetical protein CLH_3245 [Clostridium botulinum E3 str. Alaska E43]
MPITVSEFIFKISFLLIPFSPYNKLLYCFHMIIIYAL